MAAPSALTMDIIHAMRRKLAEEQENSDTDFDQPFGTNRGNKLKRGAQHFQRGHLGGHMRFKKRIDYAGHTRYISRRNPRRFDEEGYELGPDEIDEEADLEAAARDPYHDIAVERLLMPLTSASELSTHPALSIPYKSTVLPQIIDQVSLTLQKERRTLWHVKRMMTRLRGDHLNVPAGMMIEESDFDLFDQDIADAAATNGVENNDEQPEDENETVAQVLVENSIENQDFAAPSKETTEIPVDKDKIQEDVKQESPARNLVAENQTREEADANGTTNSSPDPLGLPIGHKSKDKSTLPNGVPPKAAPTAQTEEIKPPPTNQEPENPTADAMDEDSTSTTPAPRMLTRAQAQATLENDTASKAPTVTDSRAASPAPPPIHPLYIPPASSLPSSTLNIPAVEAEDIRRVMTFWVQKQEEVVRGMEKMHAALLEGERMRRTVWEWTRAEGHVGEMSDGEDWVDEEFWMLDGPLKKGVPEEVEEEVQPGKKTRGRRANI